MDLQNSYIKEALKLQPLSEEEKAKRHILARLYGPIATCKEKTRNGRGYNKPLWEKALADEIFMEKLKNKSLFLELGHPADREETDMRCVCACIPEMPKIINDDLYAYVDVLDTENGRLLKTLLDYGFVPGISSRGSGDVMDNNEVDPETFFLETWDIVQLPAVKKARLAICEGLDPKVKTFSKVLSEAYTATKSKKGKAVIKEAGKNLGIEIDMKNTDEIANDLTESMSLEDFSILVSVAKANGITTMGELKDYMTKNKLMSVDDALGKLKLDASAVKENLTEAGDLLPGGTPKNIADIPEAPDYALMEDTESETEEDVEVEAGTEDADEASDEASTVEDMLNYFSEYDPGTIVEWDTIKLGDKELIVKDMSLDDSIDGKVLIELNCEEITDEDIEDTDEDATDNSETEDTISDDTVAEDDGAESGEVVESVKELIRQKSVLEATIRDLSNAKAVGDAKVKELTEELDKYRGAFARTSTIAATTPALKKQVETLTEAVNQQADTIKTLNENLESAKAKAVKQAEAKVKSLNESMSTSLANAEAEKTELQSKLTKYSKYAKEQANLAESYKQKCNVLLERYISSKASMLGVQANEIKSKLNEHYTLDDIDAVCDKLLTESRPTFSLGRRAAMQVNETIEAKRARRDKYIDPANGYEIDDSLLELAGLK